jgi:acylphosphatase
MQARAHLHVSGQVQGVCFRDFTQRCASALNLKGWVRNLNDGRVELVAEGGKEKILELIKNVRKGPSMARVDDVNIEWQDYIGEYSDFRITW